VLVLSDRLIVKARVDESDVGGVKTGQTASVKLDAYPDVRATGTVQHISHESRVVNNVVIYEVEVVLPAIPDVFRSGMSAEVAILQKERENALTLPADAVERGADGAWVTVSRRGGEEKRAVRLGISDGRKVEILDGVGEADTVLLRRKVYALPKGEEQRSSPLVPFGGGRRHR
jgi:macrolide-specific efflux system membrane fusion protein